MHSRAKNRLLLVAVVFAAAFVFLLCILFDPRWETNDDIAMSMVAHGYGIANVGSPNLIFSNVLWGYLVRLIPEINGLFGYSIATLGVLVLVGTAVVYGLCGLGLGHLGALSVLALILARPVLFPQFTINAGLLMVGAIVCWRLYASQDDGRALLAGFLLAFLSFLVRGHEFFLVLLVALPLLPLRTMLRQRASIIVVFALVSLIPISAFIDYQFYQDSEWKSFNELNSSRAPLTDFGADGHLKRRKDIIDRHGYSPNDIDLVAKWFFVDPNVANHKALKSMLDELGPLPTHGHGFVNALAGVSSFWHPTLLPQVLVAILLAMLRPSWKIITVWGLSIAAVFVLGFLGRPGVIRIYVPLVSLLIIAPLLADGPAPHSKVICRRRLGALVIFVAALFNTRSVFSESKTAQAASQSIRHGLYGFPSFPVVIWGGVFPFEAAYPVLAQEKSAMSYRLYSLGVFTLAPFSVATAEYRAGHGMTDLLLGESGIPIVANEQRFGYLAAYCKEHFRGDLKELKVKQYGKVNVSWRRCDIK